MKLAKYLKPILFGLWISSLSSLNYANDTEQLIKSIELIQKGKITEGMTIIRPLAEKGNVFAQSFLGLGYQFGEGMEKNNILAKKWFKKAAEQGYDKAQVKLAKMLLDEGDPAFLDWARKAAEQENAEGQTMLGIAYYQGLNVSKDQATGLMWLNQACDQNDKKACQYLDEIRLGKK